MHVVKGLSSAGSSRSYGAGSGLDLRHGHGGVVGAFVTQFIDLHLQPHPRGRATEPATVQDSEKELFGRGIGMKRHNRCSW
jgi:hypothetical protein